MKATNAKLNVSLVASHQEVAQEMLELFISCAQKVIDVNGRFAQRYQDILQGFCLNCLVPISGRNPCHGIKYIFSA